MAVALDRSVELAATLYAVTLAGCAYLPLDTGYPVARLRAMVESAGATAVITSAAITPEPLQAGWRCPVVALPGSTDGSAEPGADLPTGDQLGAQDPLYVIFTSGSTGEPKPILMQHGPQIQLFEWAHRQYAPQARTLQYFPITTDVASYELYSGWWSGAEVVMATERDRHDIAALVELIQRHELSRLLLPVSAMQSLAEQVANDPTPVRSVRELITTGERLRLTAEIRAMADSLAPVSIDDQYGASEINVVTASRWTTPTEDWPPAPPLGPALPGLDVRVLDDQLRPVPRNVVGELYVSGPALAYGYLGRAAATASSFLPDPFSDTPGERMYRTGDLARKRASGSIELLGRADFQLKVHGYRVEPGEIESVLKQRPDVADCVVTTASLGQADDVLAAYVVASGLAPYTEELRDHLASRLPAHMVPQAVVLLDALPLNRSGKIDRAQLPAPELAEPAFVAPRDELERGIAAIWSQVLGIEQVAVHHNFFALGGHSMLVTRVVYEVGDIAGVQLPLSIMFEKPTISELADHVRSLSAEQQSEVGIRA